MGREPPPPAAQVTLEQLVHDPHPVHARLRDAAPVCWVPVLDGWLVTRHDLVRQVLADPTTFTVDDTRFSTARVVGPSMLSLDGVEHRRHRRPFVAGFRRADARAAQRTLVATLASGLVKALAARGQAEVRTEVAGPLAIGVMATVLGLPAGDADRLAGWYRAIVESVTAISAGHGPTPAGATAFTELSSAVLAAAESTGSGAGTGAAGVLASGRDHRAATADLTPEELVSNAAVVMFGGIETTEAITATAVLHLLSHPDRLSAARERADLVGRAVEESLRLEPAAARVDRYAVRDTVLAGQPIRRGDLVIASLAAANRDPSLWPDPDRYHPERPAVVDHLAFAHGPHACPAADLARWQAVAVIRELLALPGLRLDPERSDAPRGLVFRKPHRVRAVWES